MGEDIENIKEIEKNNDEFVVKKDNKKKTSKVFLLLCIIVSIQFAILYEKKISVKAKDTRYTIGRVRKG